MLLSHITYEQFEFSTLIGIMSSQQTYRSNMNRTSHLLCTTVLCAVNLFFFNNAFAQDQQEQSTSAQISQELGVQEAATTETSLDRSKLSYSNKWRIKFDNRAKSDGTLVFRMTLKGSDDEPVVVNIPIKNGTGENNAADAVKLALRKAFPKKFKVEGDDGESVLVKLNFTEGSSSLELLSNDVKNLKIKIKKE